MKITVLIAGGRKSTEYNELGYLASEIVSYLSMKMYGYSIYSEKKNVISRDMHSVIYTEKDGERLQEIIDLCQEEGFNLLNLATGVIDKVIFPKDMNFVFVDAPNANIDILKQIKQIEDEAKNWEKDKHIAVVSEWHQYLKSSLPGTAKEIAKILEDILLNGQIYSGRSPKEALIHGIPQEYLSGFGLHIVEIYEKANILSGQPIKEYRMEVLGRKTYAYGALETINAMKKITKGKYHISDLIRDKIL